MAIKEENRKPRAREEIKTIFKLGTTSLAFSLPSVYVKNNNLQAGDQVRVFYDDFLYMMPVKKEKLNAKLEKIKDILVQG